MKQLDQLGRIEAMLRLMLTNSNNLHTVGGYVCGRTSDDKAYVILYPASDHLDKKAVRVYEENFHKLPDFLSLSPDEVEDDADGGNPDKEKARRKGWYRECAQEFDVLISEGKMTDIGKREKRFYRVLRVYPPRTSPPPPQASPAPASNTPPRRTQESPPRREPSAPPATGGRGDAPATKKEQADAHYRKETRTSPNRFAFITAFGKLYPEVAADSIAKSVEFYCGYFTPPLVDDTPEFEANAGFLAAAVGAYWEAMIRGETHAAAKEIGAREIR